VPVCCVRLHSFPIPYLIFLCNECHLEELTEAELWAFCQGQISHQKIPRYFQFVESYPLTGSGKVQKFVLREQAVKALGLA
jgi:acyl-CoA synthetase (AMP-forming)/AMP-acid ligase II